MPNKSLKMVQSLNIPFEKKKRVKNQNCIHEAINNRLNSRKEN
jgi:hypothetical protein